MVIESVTAVACSISLFPHLVGVDVIITLFAVMPKFLKARQTPERTSKKAEVEWQNASPSD